MSLQRDNFYFDYEPFVAERLSTNDVGALVAQEEQWVEQARVVLPPDQFTIAQSQWDQWLAQSPAYRLLAYNDSFGGNADDVPLILNVAVGWSPGDNNPDMEGLFAKANDAIAHGTLFPGTGTGNPSPSSSSSGSAPKAAVGLNGMGVLLLAGLGLWWISKENK